MDGNPYTPPQASLEAASDTQPSFYVVGIRKFTLLFLSTLGMYSIYWFYANWKAYKIKHQEKMWPVARAIFNIFYAHSLFAKVQEKLDKDGTEFDWSPGYVATAYVLLSICSNVLSRMSLREVWSPGSDILSLLIVLPLFYTVLVAQKAINCAEGEAAVAANDTLTWANYLWIILGVTYWLLGLLGLLVITGVVNVEA